jgi:hypothetical protein
MKDLKKVKSNLPRPCIASFLENPFGIPSGRQKRKGFKDVCGKNSNP